MASCALRRGANVVCLRRIAQVSAAARRHVLPTMMNSTTTNPSIENISSVLRMTSIRSISSTTWSSLSSTTSSSSPPTFGKNDTASTMEASSNDSNVLEQMPTPVSPTLVKSDDSTYALMDTTIYPKLKPFIVKRRLASRRTIIGEKKDLRHSPWRTNLVCQLAAGLPVEDAMTQLEFCDKKAAPWVQSTIRKAANLADMKYGLQLTQLKVSECFATPGTPMKRIQIMGRGRFGKRHHKVSHIRVVLQEIDFALELVQARTLNQKKKWFQLQQRAERDAERSLAERRELERLEKEQQTKEKQKEQKQ